MIHVTIHLPTSQLDHISTKHIFISTWYPSASLPHAENLNTSFLSVSIVIAFLFWRKYQIIAAKIDIFILERYNIKTLILESQKRP